MHIHTRIGALLAAALLAGSFVPQAAFATTSTRDVADTTATITGIHAGDTVIAYQVFDTDIDATNQVSYTAAQGLPEAYDTVAELQALAGNDVGLRSMAEAYAAAFTAGTATTPHADSATATAGANGSATLTLDSGYWVAVVTGTSGVSQVYQPMTIDATPEAVNGSYASRNIASRPVKTEPIAIDKGVGTDYGETTDAYSVGDLVPYRVRTTVPNYPSNATGAIFTIADAPDQNLSIDIASIKVQIGAGDNAVTVYDGSLPTPATSGVFSSTPTVAATGYTFAFDNSYLLQYQGQNVTITYNATLGPGITSVASGAATNTATVTYNPNAYAPAATAQLQDTTTVHTYGYVFHKVDSSNNALAGATFTLYRSDGTTAVMRDGTPYTFTTAIASDNNAYAYFSGLAAGEYVIKETRVPAGKEAVGDATVTLTANNATGDNPATSGVAETNFEINGSAIMDPDAQALPLTGGPGTIAMTVAGLGLLVVAVSLTMHRRSSVK